MLNYKFLIKKKKLLNTLIIYYFINQLFLIICYKIES